MTNLKAGAILSRGTRGLRPDQLKDLLDNADKVKAILDEIEARRAIFIEVEAKAMARVDEADKAEAGLAKREGVLVVESAALEADTAEAAKKQQANMDALKRRTREVVAMESAVAETEAALDARETALAATEADIEQFNTRLNEAVAAGRAGRKPSTEDH